MTTVRDDTPICFTKTVKEGLIFFKLHLKKSVTEATYLRISTPFSILYPVHIRETTFIVQGS
jgi:hypothetical protein